VSLILMFIAILGFLTTKPNKTTCVLAPFCKKRLFLGPPNFKFAFWGSRKGSQNDLKASKGQPKAPTGSHKRPQKPPKVCPMVARVPQNVPRVP
jgi:hypothetical protein